MRGISLPIQWFCDSDHELFPSGLGKKETAVREIHCPGLNIPKI